jgi:hypothetical protein
VRTFRIEGEERELEGCRGECREGRLIVSDKAGGDIEGGDPLSERCLRSESRIITIYSRSE